MQLNPLFIALTLVLAPAAHATNLSEVFSDALAYDAQYAAARAAREAGQEATAQARAGLLPSVNASGNVRYNSIESSLPGGDADYDSNGAALNAAQPLYRRQNQVQYAQAKQQVKIADLQFVAATQDLILRVAQAYFDVLESQDNIAFINAQKAAISEQLAFAKRNFEVGTATITDTHEAQARYDLAVAQEIAEQNNLNIRLRALEKLTGRPAGSLDTLSALAELSIEPGSIDEWAARAADGNVQAEIQRLAKVIADKEVERNRAGRYPTVDAVAGYTINNNQNFGNLQVDTRVASVGLELNLPVYQGGLVSSRVREAVANQERARQELEAAMRDASLQARQAWLNVNSGLARVRALEQAVVSTQAQLDSTKLGLEVGVRTNLDALDAEQQVLSARRDLAGARYAYLLSGLSLKAASGTHFTNAKVYGTANQALDVMAQTGGSLTLKCGGLEKELAVKKLTEKSVELKYDTGISREALSNASGHIIEFTPPAVPFTVKNISINALFSSKAEKGVENNQFDVQILDKDLKVLHTSTFPFSRFPGSATWVDFDVPGVKVSGRFYILLYTKSPRYGIHVGVDDKVTNEHSDVAIRDSQGRLIIVPWPYSTQFWYGERSKVNWMVRVTGNANLPED